MNKLEERIEALEQAHIRLCEEVNGLCKEVKGLSAKLDSFISEQKEINKKLSSLISCMDKRITKLEETTGDSRLGVH